MQNSKKQSLKFLIIGATTTENTKDLVDEIETRGHHAETIKPADFIFSVEQNQFNIFCKDKGLLDYDIYLLRGFTIRLMETQILADRLLKAKKIVIDESVGKVFYPSKMFEASKLTSSGLNYPKTYQILDSASLELIKDKLSYPAIIKPVQGQKGQGIVKCDNEKDLKSCLNKTDERMLIQEYLPIDGDIRVFVVAEEVLGAMKRHVLKGDFRSNASLGAATEKYMLTSEIKGIALAATKALNLEIAGVDLAEVNGKWYILEVNVTPQWQNFKKVTGINPAKNIIDYAINKHEQKT